MLILATESTLARADWIVLGAYFAMLIGSGVWFSRRKVTDTQDYFLANRSMPVWAVALSILATAQSAATFVGVPQSSYLHDLSYLSANIGGLIAAFILAAVFIPAYYRLNVTTPYMLLETRFGPNARTVASLAYLIGRVFASGARVFLGSAPACLAVFGDRDPTHMCIVFAAFIIFGILYTFMGGISSAIWTDVIQVGVYLGAAVLAIAFLLHRIPAPLGDIVHALANPPSGPPKLTVMTLGLDASKPWLGFDISKEFSLLTVTTGFVLLTLASYGMDQDLVQRMLTCQNAAKGARSVISGVLVGIPAVCIFLVLGLLLYIFYQRPDIMGGAFPGYKPPDDSPFETFAYREMNGGLAGLFLAGLFAAGPAGINSGLNSMASTFVTDIYQSRVKGRDETHYLKVGRLAVVGAGVVLGLFACLCIVLYDPEHGTLISFALKMMNYAYAGLLGMFFTALFTNRGNTASVTVGWFAGFLTVLLLEPSILHMWKFYPKGKQFDLAFPWQLVISTLVATAVCMLGTRKKIAAPSIATSTS